jgi:FemAB-related protein (PEP-CTERM system-associated)
MISCRLISEQEIKLWDDFVESHPDSNPYQRFAWGQAVAKAYGHSTRYFIAERGSIVTGILPTILFRRPLGKSKLISLPFCDIGGLLAKDFESESLLISYASQFTETNGHGEMEIRQGGEAIDTTEQLSTQKVRMLMPMPDSAETLLASFKSKLRSQIKKAEKNGLSFKLSSAPEQTMIDDFYKVFSLNMRSLGSPVHSKEWFQAIIKYYQPNLAMVCVYFESKPIGGGIVIKNGAKASIPWASTDAEYNRLAPNMLLYWQLLAHCSENNIKEFDFGRSTMGEGTYKFKSQWGARPFALKWEQYSDETQKIEVLQSEIGSTNKIRSIVEKYWAFLPLSFTTSLGPIVRKYISL